MFKRIRFSVLIVVGLLLMFSAPWVSARPAHQEEPPCVGDPSCYEPPPVNSSSGEATPVIKPVWEGFSDGRLNPELAEYYSVWCVDGFVRVLRGVPTTALVDDIPLTEVYELADGGSLIRNSGLSIMRQTDTITLSGNNGNLASLGTKSFLLTQCVERNGGLSLPEPAVISDNLVQQPAVTLNQGESGAEETPEPRMSNPLYRWLAGDNSEDNLLWLIIQFVEALCGVPQLALVMMPTAWHLRNRRKKRSIL
jgi:hypothetical protein